MCRPPTASLPSRLTRGGAWRGGKAVPAITTDGQGRYSVPLLDLSHETYVSPPPSFEADGTEYKLILLTRGGLGWADLEVRADLDMPEVHRHIHLQPAARVSGTVVGYPGGTAMAGVTVRVCMDLQMWMMHNWPAVEELVTDEEGRFQAVAALPPDLLFAEPVLGKGCAIMDQDWQPADKAAVGDRHVTVSLVRDSAIEGRVSSPDGTPLANTHSVFGDRLESDTDAEGRYQLKLKAGHMFYGSPAQRPRYVWLAPRVPGVGVGPPVRVDVTEGPLSYDCHLSAPATIVGKQIEEHEGVPTIGANVSLAPVVEETAPGDSGAPPGLWWDGEGRRALCWDEEKSVRRNDETGEFRLEGVPPGEYWLEATGWTIHGLTAENGEAPRITVPPGGTVTLGTLKLDHVPRLYLDLMRGPSDLDSYEATAFVRPAGSTEPPKELFVWSGGGGFYVVWARDCDPGRYDLVMVARKHGSRYATVLHTMDLAGDPPTEYLNFDLGGAAVTGRVTLPDGVAGIPHITVTGRAQAGDAAILNGDMQEWGHFQVETDADGNFSIAHLLPGEYELRAHLPEEFYGVPPTLRIALSVNQQAAVVLRAERVEW